MQNPAPILSSRDDFLQQKQTAERLYTQFEEAELRTNADDPADHEFNAAASGVLSGLLAAVLLVHAGAHEFQVGAEKNARTHITAVRVRRPAPFVPGWSVPGCGAPEPVRELRCRVRPLRGDPWRVVLCGCGCSACGL